MLDIMNIVKASQYMSPCESSDTPIIRTTRIDIVVSLLIPYFDRDFKKIDCE